MNPYANRLSKYEDTAVQTSSPEKLVVLLYEGAIRFLRQAATATQSRNIEQKRQSVDRALAVIQHLQSTLDRDKGGDVAVTLDRLYIYITSRIVEGSGKLQVAPFEEAIKLLSTLLSGWEGIANKQPERAVPTTLLAQQATSQRIQFHG
ncbi:MAG TPA: flagellar export chaperone FliS [Terriglobia bacterium]|nr:flagellar export chaperone FliS [Terriglobia bacterium]